MDRDELFREHNRAMALGDGARARELHAQIKDEDREDHYDYVTALFTIAVVHRLGEEPSVETIKRFVDEMASDYRKAEPPLDSSALESLIRALYGESDLLDGVSAEIQLQYQFLSIRKIVDQSPQLTENLDGLLKDASKLCAIWSQEDDS